MIAKKTKSKREKGNDFQRWIRDYLQKKGWIVRNFPTEMRPLKIKDKKTGELKDIFVPRNNDVFGADLIAIKELRIMFVAASLDPHIKRRVEEFEKYFKVRNSNIVLQIWIKTDKGINIKICRYFNEQLKALDYGKIIRGKFYSPEDPL